MKLEFEGLYLMPYQKEMMVGVDWLIANPVRAEGKSMLMCMSFLKLAFNNIGHEYEVYDHYDGGDHNKYYMFAMIENLFYRIKNNEMYRLDINDRESKIKVRYATNEELMEARERSRK